jgi:lipopolysaccharide transport system ATP-binding protein
MSSDVALAAYGLGKRYRLGVASAFDYNSLRDRITDGAGAVWRGLRGGRRTISAADHIWALDDVSFGVGRGEVVGIIGRNGAGKSTLLKILSRITRPTRGHAEVHGRLGSLLEVGTGFHPELSGRDNISLNGAILGMRRAEIGHRFDEIVAFAGVEQFLDTPVKHYSSGMYVRLAFAVAAHLESEILLVDEVLAVGDAEFQRKCLGKMESVVHEGRTILFVSHNMAAVKALCRRALLIDRGRIVADGGVDAVIDQYLGAGRAAMQLGAVPDDVPRAGTGTARFRRVELRNRDDQVTTQAYLGRPLRLVVEIEVLEPVADGVVEVGLSSLDGTRVATLFTVDGGAPPVALPCGRYCIGVEIECVLLPRRYTVDVGLHHTGPGTTIDMVSRAFDFDVLNVAETGRDSYFPGVTRGFVRPPARWDPPRAVVAAVAAASTLP